jgi:hypothetical protein
MLKVESSRLDVKGKEQKAKGSKLKAESRKR